MRKALGVLAMAAVLLSACTGGSPSPSGGSAAETEQPASTTTTQADLRLEQPIECPPPSPRPCVMRPVPGDLSTWTIHNGNGTKIGVTAS